MGGPSCGRASTAQTVPRPGKASLQHGQEAVGEGRSKGTSSGFALLHSRGLILCSKNPGMCPFVCEAHRRSTSPGESECSAAARAWGLIPSHLRAWHGELAACSCPRLTSPCQGGVHLLPSPQARAWRGFGRRRRTRPQGEQLLGRIRARDGSAVCVRRADVCAVTDLAPGSWCCPGKLSQTHRENGNLPSLRCRGQMCNSQLRESCTPSGQSCLLQGRELRAPHHPGSASVVTWPLPSVSNLPLCLAFEDTGHRVKARLDHQGWS